MFYVGLSDLNLSGINYSQASRPGLSYVAPSALLNAKCQSIFKKLSCTELSKLFCSALSSRGMTVMKKSNCKRFLINYKSPSVATMMALIVCNRFSASSKTTECLLRKTSSVTSSSANPYFS